jgi:AcrR family transcriptional regulator
MMDHGGSEQPEPALIDLESDALSARARAKGERRARLTKAARALISEKPAGNFSMTELAARAGLSLATPYNLFGSKTAILQAVFRTEAIGFHKRTGSLANAPPVTQVLTMIDNIVAVFGREPAFYRSLTRSLMAITPDELSASILPISDSMFLPLVEGLVGAGAIRPPIPASVISTHLLRVFNSIFLLWAAQNWDASRLHRELRTGFALCFIGLFDGEDRNLMLRELADRDDTA